MQVFGGVARMPGVAAYVFARGRPLGQGPVEISGESLLARRGSGRKWVDSSSARKKLISGPSPSSVVRHRPDHASLPSRTGRRAIVITLPPRLRLRFSAAM